MCINLCPTCQPRAMESGRLSVGPGARLPTCLLRLTGPGQRLPIQPAGLHDAATSLFVIPANQNSAGCMRSILHDSCRGLSKLTITHRIHQALQAGVCLGDGKRGYSAVSVSFM